ncbi:MAG: hypothetical protein Q9181_007447 [Wetmoreana brouardii]
MRSVDERQKWPWGPSFAISLSLHLKDGFATVTLFNGAQAGIISRRNNSSITDLLSNREILPNLEFVDWQDNIILRPSVFEAFTVQNIRHLKIGGARVDRYFTLFWPQDGPIQEHQPPLPSLRHLRLSSLLFFTKYPTTYLLDNLVHDGIVSLDFDFDPKVFSQKFERNSFYFGNRGHIEALQTLVWRVPKTVALHSIALLQANTQLLKLRIPNPMSERALNEQLLPLIARSFTMLTSLSLAWDSEVIVEKALECISTVTTLKQIHLSAGDQFGEFSGCDTVYYWEINHQIIRKHFASLSSLRRLAFSRDTYHVHGIPDCRFYYTRGWFDGDIFFGEEDAAQRTKFEDDH